MNALAIQKLVALGTGLLAASLVLSSCVESGRQATGGQAGGECPWEPDEGVDATVRIAYQKVPNGDPIVKDLGLLESCMPNAQIKWSVFESGADVIQAYGANSIDVGYIGSSPVTIALSEPLNLPLSVVWIFDLIGGAESLVAREDSVKSIEDLRGKRIAVPFSSTAHFSLLQALENAGVDARSEVKLINLPPEQMPSAWQGGQIDAAWVWPPVLEELKAEGEVIMSSEDVAEQGKPTYDLGTARRAFVQENPDFMKQWAMAQEHAIKLIKESPEEAAESIAAELGISPKEAQKQFEGFVYLSAEEQVDSYLGEKLGADLETTAQFLFEQGSIDAAAEREAYVDAVDPGPAESVK